MLDASEVLVCVAPDITQERRMQRVAQARLIVPPGLVLWPNTEVLLNEYGSLAPIWLQSLPKRVYYRMAGRSGKAGPR